jgi:hypothetical protein
MWRISAHAMNCDNEIEIRTTPDDLFGFRMRSERSENAGDDTEARYPCLS